MSVQNFHWKFPLRRLLRFEALFIGVFTLLIFLFSYIQFEKQIVPPILFSITFLLIYALVSTTAKAVRQTEVYYHLTPTHFELTHKNRWKTKKEKVHWKDVSRHKLDHTLLGGYLLTKKGKKHLLFFNSKSEIAQFETFLKKHHQKVSA